MLFLYGDHIHEAYSKWDLTKLLYRGTKFTPFSDTNDRLITAIIPHALLMLICFSKSSSSRIQLKCRSAVLQQTVRTLSQTV